MKVKDKQLLQRGYKHLLDKLGEERAAEFLGLVIENGMGLPELAEISNELDEKRRKKEEEAEKKKEMARAAIKSITEKEFQAVLEEYKVFLKTAKVDFSDNQGFYIWIKQKEKESIHISVSRDFSDGRINLSAYAGRALTMKVRPVQSFVKQLEMNYPMYYVYEEVFHKYSHEISLYDYVEYSTVEELHHRVVLLCEAVEKVRIIGTELFGDNYEP